MRLSCERDLPWFVGGPVHNGEMVIVGGGPSVLTRLDAIERRQSNNDTIVACNGANGLLRKNGIEPDLVVLVDPSPAVAGFVTKEEDDGATYLVSSICHPDVFDALSDRMVFLWHPEIPGPQGVGMKIILDEYPDKPVALIGGGCTGALRSLSLGYALGFREFHMYGVDSSYESGGPDHAYTKHDGPEPQPIFIQFDGKNYCCSPWMARQASEFQYYYVQLANVGCSIVAHGTGLIPGISRFLAKARRNGEVKVIAPETVIRAGKRWSKSA